MRSCWLITLIAWEKEIPEFPDEIYSLVQDIDHLERPLTYLGFNWNQPNWFTWVKFTNIQYNTTGKTNKTKADIALVEDINYVLNDDRPLAESNGPCSRSSSVIPSSPASRNTAKKEDWQPRERYPEHRTWWQTWCEIKWEKSIHL